MSFDEQNQTYEGREFPSESEWLELEPPADLPISDDFVARTLTALRDPAPQQLATFAAPAPSADFVDRTMAALHVDRRRRWRELLARYVVPEPSGEFVTRTLRALERESGGPAAAGRLPSRRRVWTMPLLAAAAVLAVAFLLPRDDDPIFEVRATETLPAAFGPAHAASPLPALLTELDRQADPDALPATGGDGVILLLQRSGK